MGVPGTSGEFPARLVWLVVCIAAYALAVYWSSAQANWVALALALLPAIWLTAAFARRAADGGRKMITRVLSTIPLLVLLAATVTWSDRLIANVRWLYLVQHVGIHAALCWVFARTLLTGRTPLCTELAAWVHDDMSSPRLLWYTRRVTFAWAVFFALMAIVSLALYVGASPKTWTVFSTGVGVALTGAFFVIENLMRSMFLPAKDRVGLIGTWRAVRHRLTGSHPTNRPDGLK